MCLLSQDAKHRWDELQNYLHNMNAEREKLQAAKQGRNPHTPSYSHQVFCTHHLSSVSCVFSELQNQLMVVESEMTSKNKEIQTLHSNLTDTHIFKEQEQQKAKQLEQQVRQLLEASQHTMQPDNQLQEQAQVPEESQYSLNSKEACMHVIWLLIITQRCLSQDLLNENKMLKVQIDNLQTQLNAQVCVWTAG